MTGPAGSINTASRLVLKRMNMHFIIYKDKKKEYRWRLQTSNGRIIADSGEGYTRMRNCRSAVDRLNKKFASPIKIYE